MEINNLYDLGDTVFLKTCLDQFPRIVTGIIIRPNGTLVYECSFVMGSSQHYDFEMSKEKDTLVACGIEAKSTN